MKDNRDAEFNNLTEQMKILEQYEQGHNIGKHLNKLKKKMSSERYESDRAERLEKGERS